MNPVNVSLLNHNSILFLRLFKGRVLTCLLHLPPFFLFAHYAQAVLAFLFPGALSCIAAVINRGLSPNGVPRVPPHPSSPMVFFFQVSAFMSFPQRDLSVVPDPTSRSFSSQFLSQFPLFLFGY